MKLYVVLQSYTDDDGGFGIDEFFGAFETRKEAIEAIKEIYKHFNEELPFTELTFIEPQKNNSVAAATFTYHGPFRDEHYQYDVVEYQMNKLYIAYKES